MRHGIHLKRPGAFSPPSRDPATTLPTTGVFLEHLAMSFGFRTAYKSFGGFEWAYELADALGLYEMPTAMRHEVMG